MLIGHLETVGFPVVPWIQQDRLKFYNGFDYQDWEANAVLPEEVVQAALPYIDVLSFQCFGTVGNIATKMQHWAGFADCPILLADVVGFMRAHGDTSCPPTADRLHDIDHYHQVMDALWDTPQCVGYHLCGAYIRNNARKYGFCDPVNNQINETVAGILAINTEMQRRQNP